MHCNEQGSQTSTKMNSTGHTLEHSQNATPATYEANNQQNPSPSTPTLHTSEHDGAAVGDALFDFVQSLKGKSLSQSMWAPKGRASRTALPSSWGTTNRLMSPQPMASAVPIDVKASACKDSTRSDSKQGPPTSNTDASTQTDTFLVLSLLGDERIRQSFLQQVQVKLSLDGSPSKVDCNPTPSTQLVGCQAISHQQNQQEPNQGRISDETVTTGLDETPADQHTDKKVKQGPLEIAKEKVSSSEWPLATKNAPSSQENNFTAILTVETIAPDLEHRDLKECGALKKEESPAKGGDLQLDSGSSPKARLDTLSATVEQPAKENQDPSSTADMEAKTPKRTTELPSLHQLGGFNPTAYGRPKAHRTYTAEDRTNQVYFESWGAAEPRDRPCKYSTHCSLRLGAHLLGIY